MYLAYIITLIQELSKRIGNKLQHSKVRNVYILCRHFESGSDKNMTSAYSDFITAYIVLHHTLIFDMCNVEFRTEDSLFWARPVCLQVSK